MVVVTFWGLKGCEFGLTGQQQQQHVAHIEGEEEMNLCIVYLIGGQMYLSVFKPTNLFFINLV